jgi:hypothetical protein
MQKTWYAGSGLHNAYAEEQCVLHADVLNKKVQIGFEDV